MRTFFQKLFTPWRAGACFHEEEAFFAFLVRCNRRLNTVRVILFAAAAVLLFIGYNADPGGSWSIAAINTQPFYLIAVGVLVLALGVSLIIIENEKQLPEALRQK